MGKRQLRLEGVKNILQGQERLIGEEVNVILTNHSVVYGKILTLSSDKLTLRNMRLRPVDIDLGEVREIILDY